MQAQMEYEAAATAFRETLKLDPKQGVARTLLAECLVALNKNDEALAALNEGIADPQQSASDRISFQVKAGDIDRVQKKYDEARAEYGKLLKMDVGDKGSLAKREAARCLAQTDFDQGKFEAAAKGFEESLKFDPEYIFSQYMAGQAYQQAKLNDKAVEAYTKASTMKESQPNYAPAARLALARLYVQLEKLPEAQKTLEDMLALQNLPESTKARAGALLAKVKEKLPAK